MNRDMTSQNIFIFSMFFSLKHLENHVKTSFGCFKKKCIVEDKEETSVPLSLQGVI